MISGQALRAAGIIRRVRSLVRARAPNCEPCDVNALIQEVSALIRSEARLQGVELSLEFAEGLPPVEVDGIQIQQVLLNLIHNSIEALTTVADGERRVTVRTAKTTPDELTISVIDSGPGVDPQLAGRIFEPFCTTKEQGTGLGLAISKSIIEAHRGRLLHLPNRPSGACFLVCLPVVDRAR
jgi:signal transduction histidine kinase